MPQSVVKTHGVRPRRGRANARGVLVVLMLAGASWACAEEDGTVNIALFGEAKSWLPGSLPSPYAPASRANDGDPVTFWASTEPSTDPPKDIGIEWEQPQKVGAVRVKFYSIGYLPTRDGWALEALIEGQWRKLEAIIDNPDCEWWTLRFNPVVAKAIRFITTRYTAGRPSVCEVEVYASSPPQAVLRRPPMLDGAFWAFHYENWAKHFASDQAIADEVKAAHRIGLDTTILYTLSGRDGAYSTVVPETAIAQSEWWRGRDPLEAILSEADRVGVRVYVGDAPPNGFSGQPVPEEGREVKQRLYEYRRQVLLRYSGHRSLVGYYINFEACPDNFDNAPVFPAQEAEELAAFVKSTVARLRVIQPVGLYSWRDTKQGAWRKVTPEELVRFWRPWMTSAPHIDTYMVIDGVGTGLAPLNHTDLNQACIRALCDELGKEMWTDVECAEFKGYTSMPIGRLTASIEVAAKHADHIVTFCYFNYMSPNNGRAGSRRLYEEYARCVEGLDLPDVGTEDEQGGRGQPSDAQGWRRPSAKSWVCASFHVFPPSFENRTARW